MNWQITPPHARITCTRAPLKHLVICFSEICCAEKLIQDLKRGAEREFAFRIPSSHFFQDFDKLAEEFVEIGDTALYLQDMNYLTNIYRRFQNAEFIEKMNSILKQLERNRNSSLNLVLKENELLLQGSLNCLVQEQQELTVVDHNTTSV